MKSFKYFTSVVLITALSNLRKERNTVSKNGKVRNITHRVELVMTAQMVKDHDFLASNYTSASGRPLGLGQVNSAGHLVVDLADTAIGKLASTAGCTVAQLPLTAKGAELKIGFDLREQGDIVIGRANEEIEITSDHVQMVSFDMTIPKDARFDLLVASQIAADFIASRNATNAPSTPQIEADGGQFDFEDADIPVDEFAASTSNPNPNPANAVNRPNPRRATGKASGGVEQKSAKATSVKVG